MEQVLTQVFKDSIFAGFLGVVLVYLMRQLDQRIKDATEVGLVNGLMITQLTRSFEAHDITVTGINPSVDMTELDDDRARMVLAKYQSIDSRLASIENEIVSALHRVRGSKK